MLKVLNENYYLDLDAIAQYINTTSLTGEPETHINVVKYEVVKTMLEVIMTEDEEVDEALGQKSTGLTIPFKLAFNTLLNKKLINKY
jgi:hypothetical protein